MIEELRVDEDDIIQSGLFTETQIQRILFIRQYHRDHPHEHEQCRLTGKTVCHASEELAKIK